MLIGVKATEGSASFYPRIGAAGYTDLQNERIGRAVGSASNASEVLATGPVKPLTNGRSIWARIDSNSVSPPVRTGEFPLGEQHTLYYFVPVHICGFNSRSINK